MNLIIDIGNTRIKAGIFEHNTLIKCITEQEINSILEWANSYKIDKIILSSVVNLPNETLNLITKFGKTILFSANTPTPVHNLYNSAQTLGSDRLAAACGGYIDFKGKPFLVIDAGTCLKYNYTDADGNYHGGGISPGLAMRYLAMHKFTKRLPLVAFDPEYNSLIGNDTINSLRMGAQLGIIAEVKGIIEEYKKMNPNINIVLTGGDAPFLQKALKSNIFADPLLLLKGLNSILNYQK